MSVFFGQHNIISPLGFTSEVNFEAVRTGKSALQPHVFDFSEQPFFCSKLHEQEVDRQFVTLAPPAAYTYLEKLCILSIHDVIQQSGFNPADKNNLLLISTTKGNIDVLENKYPQLSSERAYLPVLGKTLGDFFKCAHAPLVLSNACISGLLAVIVAKRFIENKVYRNVLVCGADLVSEFTLSGFKSFNAVSDERCKPFDAARKGINLGEAAASVLLSTEPLSNIHLVSGASANDANHISGPSRTGDGLYKALSEIMTETGIKDIGFICAHGTATEYNDNMEAVAFSRAGLGGIPLNSLKAYYGHTLGAAGVLESIISVQALHENYLLYSLGYEHPGTSEALAIITKTEKKEMTSCLKTASGFGGCNAAAIFEKI